MLSFVTGAGGSSNQPPPKISWAEMFLRMRAIQDSMLGEVFQCHSRKISNSKHWLSHSMYLPWYCVKAKRGGYCEELKPMFTDEIFLEALTGQLRSFKVDVWSPIRKDHFSLVRGLCVTPHRTLTKIGARRIRVSKYWNISNARRATFCRESPCGKGQYGSTFVVFLRE